MEDAPDRFRAMAEGGGYARRARSGLWLSLVAEHKAGAVAQRPGIELRRHWQRREYHLDRPGPRYRRGLALVPEFGNGRHGAANRGCGYGSIAGAVARLRRRA